MYRSLNTGYLGFDVDVETAISVARDCGYKGVDLGSGQVLDVLRRDDGDDLWRFFEESGILPGCFTLHPRNASGGDSEWERELERLPSLCRKLSALGFSRSIIVVLPFHEKLDYEANFELHRRRIRQVCDILQPFGILLGLEYIAPLTRRDGFPFDFVHNLAGLQLLRSAVDRPNAGILLDCFHWYCAGEGESDIRALDPEQISAVHISDAVHGRSKEEQMAFERQLPDTSKMIDIGSFFQALRAIGYEGPVSCEPFCDELNLLPLPEAAGKVGQAMDSVMRTGTM